MINIGLCYKSDKMLRFLHTELCKCFDHRCIDYNIYCCHNTAEIRRCTKHRCFDLFFYDIMGECGLVRRAVLSLKTLNPRLVSVIFADNHDPQPVDDTLLEPFYRIPDKSREQLWTYAFLAYEAFCNQETIFSYYKRPAYSHIPIETIKYFCSEKRCTHIRCIDSKQDSSFYKKLNEVEAMISSKKCTFFRIHQSYLVNAKYVTAFNRSHVVLITGEQLPISKYEYYKEICSQISEKKVRQKYRRLA